MTNLWRRFRRLCQESEIRLDPAALSFDGIRPGDRLQTGSRLWRVERRLEGEDGLELVALEDGKSECPSRSRVRLRFEGSDPFCPWIFEDRESEVRLASRDLLHFPVARFVRLDPPGPRR